MLQLFLIILRLANNLLQFQFLVRFNLSLHDFQLGVVRGLKLVLQLADVCIVHILLFSISLGLFFFLLKKALDLRALQS